jgi:hypothetical protein
VIRILQRKLRDSNQLKDMMNETSEQDQGNRCDTRTLLKVVEEKDKKDCCEFEYCNEGCETAIN